METGYSVFSSGGEENSDDWDWRELQTCLKIMARQLVNLCDLRQVRLRNRQWWVLRPKRDFDIR